MLRRTRLLVAAVVIGAASLVAIGGATPGSAEATDLKWCSDVGHGYPCIASATRAGVSVKGDPTWSVLAQTLPISGDPSKYLLIYAQKDGGFDLEGDTAIWSVRVDLGARFIPRVASGHAHGVTVTRSHPADYFVTVTGRPVLMAGDCDQSQEPWTCPEVATSQTTVLQAQVTDYAVWEDVDQRNAMYGMDYFDNIAAGSVPPQVVHDSSTGADALLIEIANPHFEIDGTTVFHGHAELRIPNAFLKLAYEVPDPATMTGGSLLATVSGGSGTVTTWQESGADAMRVQLDGVTFSRHNFLVRRGTIVPTRPGSVHAKRTATHRARVSFTNSKPRGARVTGYRATCTWPHGGHALTATATRSPVVVRGLIAGHAYTCWVRAHSKAGYGPRSAKVRVPKRP